MSTEWEEPNYSYQVGAVLGRYIVEDTLGEGGTAVVLKARHQQLGSTHAIKVLKVRNPSAARRAVQEGQVQSQLKHPNVVQVTDLLTVDDAPALVMEHIEGPSLSQLLRRGKLSGPQCDSIARGIMAGVAAAHARGLVHRDLKPANVMLAVQDGVFIPKVTDFGLAKIAAGAPRSHTLTDGLTVPGRIMGTPAYMSPEQFENSSEVDARADIFSLGALLYELVTGTQCFAGDSVMTVWRKIAAGDYQRIRELAPETPERMQTVIESALEVDLERRASSVAALARIWRTGERGQEVVIDDTELRSGWMRLLKHENWSDETTPDHSPEVHATTHGAIDTTGSKDESVVAITVKESLSRERRGRLLFTLAIVGVLSLVGVFMTKQAERGKAKRSLLPSAGISATDKPSRLLVGLTGQPVSADLRRIAIVRKALLRGSLAQVREELKELGPDVSAQPAVQLIWSVLAWLDGAPAEVTRRSSLAESRAQTTSAKLAALLRAYHDTTHRLRDEEELRRLWKSIAADVATDPVARLVHLVALTHLNAEPDLRLRLQRELRSAPDQGIWALMELRLLRRSGRHKAHRQTLAQAEAHFGSLEAFKLERVFASLQTGDFKRTKRLVNLLDATKVAPHVERVQALIGLHEDDEVVVTRSLVVATGDTREPHQVQRFLLDHAQDLANYGAVDRAQKLLRFCVTTSTTEAWAPPSLGAPCAVRAAQLNRCCGQPKAAKAARAALEHLLTAKTLNAFNRQRWAATLALELALHALVSGDKMPARDVVKRLQPAVSLGQAWARRTSKQLSRALLLADTSALGLTRVKATLASVSAANTEAATPPTCADLHDEAQLAAVVQAHEKEKAALGRIVAGRCRRTTQRWLVTEAHLRLAELAAAQKKPNAVATHLARFRRNWRDESQQLPWSRRASQLDSRPDGLGTSVTPTSH